MPVPSPDVETSPSTRPTNTDGAWDPAFTIYQAVTSQDLATTYELFIAYTDWLNLDLYFQDFKTELATLPGKYAPPSGCLLLAKPATTGGAQGVIAMRPLPSVGEAICEMKRLYVLPSARGMGIGRVLIREAVRRAEEKGYREMVLDTLPSMKGAITLYRSESFIERDAYYENPIEGAIFFRKWLGR
ncbi:acetyltransferase [Eremomyces bilateralis CBS 781.70]|uniref:Acetyltransferase n=1 Tax=Eremomyces bilateralis CBS 781.70 TaxID=1392243 RepID=A0A6G1FWI1_9PEZI|nr:acetyltransferase [Eremomyces bilateralis CBS 781.70]KAF1810040.1 acetyltransferase [Eremomyces bilateralis CBS 781.70]